MKGGVAAPGAAGRHQPAARASTAIETLPDGGVRIGALVRNTDLAHDAGLRQALPGGGRGAALRRLGPAAQRRDRRRQPAAAHALRLFLRHRQRLQQARARRRLRRPAARTGSMRCSAGASTASPPILRFLRAAGRARRRRRDRGPGRPARGPAGDFHLPARRRRRSARPCSSRAS